MMRIFRLSFLTLVLAAMPLAWAGNQIYKASINVAEWQLEATPLMCKISHRIPDYGVAEFSQKPRGELVFRMHVEQAATQSGSATLLSLPPSWRHFDNGKNLGPMPIVAGNTPFYLGKIGALRLITELDAGMTPTLVYEDWIDGKDNVTVHISPVNFSRVIADFRACQQGLLPYTYDEVDQTVLMYDINQTELDKKHRQQLKRVIKYILQDDSIKKIQVDGYTDSKGLRRINLAVANKRVDEVRAYLVKKGVDRKKIVTRAYEETEGKFSNRTEEGRRKNRRVVITLIR